MTVCLSTEIINAFEAYIFSIFPITLIVPGKVVTTQQAIKVINTSEEYKFGIGELLSHSLNSYRIPPNSNALKFQLFMIL